MDERVRAVLERGGTAAMTTTGRRSGQPRRVIVAFRNIGGSVYISGRPGFPRGWMANLRAQPRFTFQIGGEARAELAAKARPISDPDERRRILSHFARGWGYDVERMVAGSPLIEVTFPEAEAQGRGAA
jgi:deazaflavin-dependent oxidoreductase (nitroreductase family)